MRLLHRRFNSSLLLCFVLVYSINSSFSLGNEPQFHSTIIDGQTFHLPEGFQIERIAGPGLVDRPITGAFDELGRLYVSDSSGTNDPVNVQLAQKPHRIMRLEDRDGDGIYDQSKVFADKMMFPEGTMWLAGSLYVAAPPEIWKLTDTDDDGVADQREVWFDGKTLTGCANDLHGPYAGPDGWVYWAKGAFAEQTYQRPGKPPFVTRAAHFFRSRPDGTSIEPVMTGGMDNPVDIAFTAGGERILNGTFFQLPGGGFRDGLIHAVIGGIYGKIHDPIFDPIHKWTGPAVMPIMVHLGPAAPAGLTDYQSEAFGPEYRENLFSTCFNMRKVTRHVLAPSGATFAASTEDFVRCDDLDFHPTDVLEDADGSLLIIDTGGWYKLCCPTSQLHKPDILGAIYRVRREVASPLDDSRGQTIPWDTIASTELAELIDDPRPVVVQCAIAELVARRDEGLQVAAQVLASRSSTPRAQRNAVWTAIRVDSPTARTIVRDALRASDEYVRQVAIHGASLWRDRMAEPELLHLLTTSTSPHNRRAAAEALGRTGCRELLNPQMIDTILATDAGDRFLEHSLTYALIELDDPKTLQSWLTSKNGIRMSLPGQRVVLTALDQLDPSRVDSAWILAHLDSTDSSLRETIVWIAGRHPDWGNQLIAYWRGKLTGEIEDAERTNLEALIARFTQSEQVQQFVTEISLDPGLPSASRVSALRVMSQSILDATPSLWLETWATLVGTTDALALPEAIRTVASISLDEEWRNQPPTHAAVKKLDASLLRLGIEQTQHADSLRFAALANLRDSKYSPNDELFAKLLVACDRESTAELRNLAARALEHAELSTPQFVELAESLERAPALALSAVLPRFQDCMDEEVGSRLLESLENSDATASIPLDRLRESIARFGPKLQARANDMMGTLHADLEARRLKLESMLPRVSSGDIRRGQAVFLNPKWACISCHEMGYVGGSIGPDLSKIGEIRGERDLLEAILFPSASFVRSYEPLTCTCHDGRVLSGVVKRDTGDELVLAVSATEEVRVPRASVDEVFPGTVSIMPDGLSEQLSEQELIDLVVFLKSRGS